MIPVRLHPRPLRAAGLRFRSSQLARDLRDKWLVPVSFCVVALGLLNAVVALGALAPVTGVLR